MAKEKKDEEQASAVQEKEKPGTAETVKEEEEMDEKDYARLLAISDEMKEIASRQFQSGVLLIEIRRNPDNVRPLISGKIEIKEDINYA